MDDSGKKLFLGPQLRRLRRERTLTQLQMADNLGISTSYLNLLERNQRPVTAQVLLKMADAFDMDMRSFGSEKDERAFGELTEIFADPLFRDTAPARQEIKDLSNLSPAITSAIKILYSSYTQLKETESSAAATLTDRDTAGVGEAYRTNPIEWVRDFIHEHHNYFPTLDEAAERFNSELGVPPHGLFSAICTRLLEKHQLQVRIMPAEYMLETLRRHDRHRHQLMISELLDPAGRTFQTAFQLGLNECEDAIATAVKEARPPDTATTKMLRISFANYIAGALMMPYGRFWEAAESLGYDIDMLGQRFGASFEQVCHRLTTLQKPTARGIPFFMVRVDNAGNISKRFSAGPFPFARFGGTCPLWNIHASFQRPNQINTQIVELPDNSRYFSIARTVQRAHTPFGQINPEFAIGLGCEIRYANRLTYARGLNLSGSNATPIGPNCRLCERSACVQRAAPPLRHVLSVDEHIRSVSPFSF